MSVRPVRIQRKRTSGYDMQAESLAANGLPCIFVGRPTHFGNPYKLELFGLELSLRLYLKTVHGVWDPALLEGRSEKLFSIAYDGHREFIDRLEVLPMKAIRSELRGSNLSCFCSLDHACHADILLEIGNGDA